MLTKKKKKKKEEKIKKESVNREDLNGRTLRYFDFCGKNVGIGTTVLAI